MTTTTTVTRTCDLCNMEIPADEKFVNAVGHGVEAHLACFKMLDALQVLRFLNLNQVKYMKHEDWDHAERVINWLSAKLPDTKLLLSSVYGKTSDAGS